MTEFINTQVDESVDPSMVMTFKTDDGDSVAVTVTVSTDGDLRRVWADLNDFSEREALHQFAGEMFQQLSNPQPTILPKTLDDLLGL